MDERYKKTNIKFQSDHVKGRYKFREKVTIVGIILKWFLKEMGCRCELDSAGCDKIQM
jgi:hypothetical protein